MKFLIAGSSGLIGTALVANLQGEGHHVKRLVRHSKDRSENDLLWDPNSGSCYSEAIEDLDVAINLAGENIASIWTESKKKRLFESRVNATRTLASSLAACQKPPQLLINASAIGIYGNQGETVLTESSPKGLGFLSDLCEVWEYATDPAQRQGIRVVYLRLGIVLSTKGGVLGKMFTPFNLGLGGIIGSGKQYMSWITIDDLISIIKHVCSQQTLVGPVNVTTPYPVTNRVFTKTLGKVLKRPTLFPLPERIIKWMLGEMGKETLLSSSRVLPQRLIESGYAFRHPHLEEALTSLFCPRETS